MSSRNADQRRRELARSVRRSSVEELHDRMAEAGVTRAFVVSENGELTLSHPKLLAPVRAFFELSQDFADHEGVFIGREEGIPTLFLVGVHDTRRGLSQGGLRFKPYDHLADLLVDVLRLARGMTRKNALAGLWWGGGKGVVPVTEPLRTGAYRTEGSPERLALFRAYGRFVASLGGIYYTAEDVGTKTSDLNAILSRNRFTTCVAPELGGSGNPSSATARGVYVAMRAAWRFLTGSDELGGVRVAVQGVGNVGGPLVELLDDAGARLWVTDVDREALAALERRRPAVTVVEPEAIFDLDADVFAPCAIGAQVNVHTIPRLRVQLVCGAANNILGEDADAERLRRRGIAYVPDYLCNRMGITNCADEWQGYLAGDVELAAERVYPDTLQVLRHARNQMITTADAADQLADLAAGELHPLIGHRGRRIIDHLVRSGWHRDGHRDGHRESSPRAAVTPAFEPGLCEPPLRVRWEREGRFRGRGPTVAAAPISAAGRPDLSSFLSALLMDVRARALELLGEERPRRAVGADPGGLALQQAVERSLPVEREEIGRPRFVERCADAYRRHDEAIRDQLHRLGVGFDPAAWLDPLSEEGEGASRRLFHALDDAGLLFRERRLAYVDPVAQTVLVSPDVVRDEVEVDERFTVRFEVIGDGAAGAEIATHTFFPELLPGAAAVAVRPGGPWGELAGDRVREPLGGGELPVVALPELATDAEFLVPAHDREDERRARELGLDDGRLAIDERGRFLVPGEPPLPREEARRRVLERLGARVTRRDGRFRVTTTRSRRSRTLVHLGASEQLFVKLEGAAEHLERAIDAGAVEFSAPRWRRRALELAADPEPWCISRQCWWGEPLPARAGEPPGDEVLSVWFTLAAWSLRAAGWPASAAPEPVDELYVDDELFDRWVVPSQLVSLAVTGRPAFRRVVVHGTVHTPVRVLEPRDGFGADAPDEERFRLRTVPRPLRRRPESAVEPATLIRRFGADALRLGYLLSLPAGDRGRVTASESRLRRGRRTVERLSSKVTGLFHLHRSQGSGEEADGGEPRAAERWLLARTAAAACAAHGAYAERRFGVAARRFGRAVDDLARYAAVAARRDREDPGPVRAAVTAAVGRLHDGFAPLCPHLLEHLAGWTRARARPLEIAFEPELAELDRPPEPLTPGPSPPGRGEGR